MVRRCLRVSVVVLLAALVACGGDDSSASGGTTPAGGGNSPEPRTIGYVDVASGAPMQQRWFAFFDGAAKVLGWEVRTSDTQGDPAAGVRAMRTFVNDGVDALVVTCLDAAAVQPGIDAARDADIPVIEIGCAEEQADAWDAWYAEDEEGLTEALVDFMAEDVGEGGKAAVMGSDGIFVLRLRTEALLEGFEQAGVEVVAQPNMVLGQDQGAVAAASDIVRTDPDVKAIAIAGNNWAPPALQGLRAFPDSEVKVYSFVLDSVQVPLMTESDAKLRALVDAPSEQLCLQAINDLLHHFENGTPLGFRGMVEVGGIEVYTADNLPDLPDDFVSPYALEDYLGTYVEQWNADFGFDLQVG